MANLVTLVKMKPSLFEDYYDEFFVRSSDTHQVGAMKLEILALIATKSSITAILQELQASYFDFDSYWNICNVIPVLHSLRTVQNWITNLYELCSIWWLHQVPVQCVFKHRRLQYLLKRSSKHPHSQVALSALIHQNPFNDNHDGRTVVSNSEELLYVTSTTSTEIKLYYSIGVKLSSAWASTLIKVKSMVQMNPLLGR